MPRIAVLISPPPPEPLILTDKERHMMEHALGMSLKANGRRARWSHRNRFVACIDSPDCLAWERMIERGLAVRVRYTGAPKSYLYKVTLLGIRSLGNDILRRVPLDLRPRT